MATSEPRPGPAAAPSHNLFILAGEPSGDRIGADLLRRLKMRRPVTAFGVGGDALLHEGLEPLFDMSDLSVMGFADVVWRLPRLLGRVRQAANAILGRRPDAAVLIDSQVFSALVAKNLRKRGYKRPILLYVAPAVWGMRPERAPRLKGVFDEILAVLPFEPRVLPELGGPKATYVGHPATRLAAVGDSAAVGKPPTVALLPGSRRGELKRHLPIFAEVAALLARNYPDVRFVLPTLGDLAASLKQTVAAWPVPVNVVAGEAREEAFAATDAALASSGTVTLELAMRGIPHVGTYVPDWIQWQLWQRAGRPRALLPNIVLDADLVPEILPGPDHAARLAGAMLPLLTDGPERFAQIDGFALVRKRMTEGEPETGIFDAVDRVESYLKT